MLEAYYIMYIIGSSYPHYLVDNETEMKRY